MKSRLKSLLELKGHTLWSWFRLMRPLSEHPIIGHVLVVKRERYVCGGLSVTPVMGVRPNVIVWRLPHPPERMVA